ncbi:MAG: A24 family peptidase [Pseudomonadota bacterium]
MSLNRLPRLIWLALFVAMTVVGGLHADLTVTYIGLSIVLGSALIALSWIDFSDYRLPNVLTLPLIAVGIGQSFLFDLVSIRLSLLGAVVGYGIFWAIGEFYFRLRNRDGLGLGDAKLLAAGGAWTGALALSPIVLIGSFLAIPFALLDRSEAFNLKTVSFGPWLAIGIWFVWVFGYGTNGLPVTLTL